MQKLVPRDNRSDRGKRLSAGVRVQDFIVGLMVFGLFFAVLGAWIHSSQRTLIEEQHFQTEQTALSQASVFELNLQRSLSAAKILGSYVEIQKGDISDFEHLAKIIHESLGGITNLQLAPDGIVEKIFPLEGHEAALGHNLIVTDNRRKEAQMAIQERSMTVAGPFNLIQGGSAIVARNPVFLPVGTPGMRTDNTGQLPSARQGDLQFWGFASVLILFNDVLALTELDSVELQGYAYRIRRQHPDTAEWQVIAGQPTFPDTFVATSPIKLPNAEWYMDVVSKTPAVAPYSRVIMWSAAVLFSGAIAMMAVGMYRRPRVLSKLVDLRTRALMQAQLELQSLQHRYELILNSAGEGIFGISRDGQITFINPAACEQLELSAEQIVGQSAFGSILGEQATGDIQLTLFRGETVQTHEAVFQRSGRGAMSVSYISAPILEGGRTIGAVITFRDISERLATERELQIAATAFDTNEALVITDTDGIVLRVNRAFNELTGLTDQEVLGTAMAQLQNAVKRPMSLAAALKQLGREDYWEGELLLVPASGDTLPVWASATAVKDRDGNVTHYVGHIVDITQRRREEQELKEAKVRAETASRAKSDFLAVMSHEIRTPLNGVLGLLELLSEAKLAPREASFLATARESGEALLEVINDILDFSKMEAGQMRLEVSTIETRKLIASISLLLGPKATSKGLTLESTFSDEVPEHFTGDPGRVRQVLLNMTSNAVKYTASGTIHIEVRGQRIAGERYRLLFAVTDTGIGIDLDRQPNLFERFATVDASYSRRYGGTGLGLSICRELVELMGGTLGVESRPGVGSRFWFELTVDAARPEDTGDVHLTLPDATAIRPLRILVVEDVVTNLLVIREMLHRAGHRVQMAENGVEAIQSLQIAPFDLVLMDLSMPEMDGLEATRAIRAMERPASEVIIIAMTAHTFEEERARCLEAGMNDYLSKPIDRKRLLATIARWFAGTTDDTRPADDNGAKQQLAEPDAIDERILAQLAEDIGAERVPELANIFVKDARKRLARLEDALREQSIDSLQREAHSLASSGATYGLPELHRLARAAEQACRDGDRDRIEAGAQQLIQQAPALIDALETFMPRWADRQKTAG